MGIVLAQRYTRIALPLVLVCQLPALGAPTDIPEVTFRTQVTEIRLTFTATDQANHAIATLNAGDLAVVDKEVIVRNFQSFTRAEFTRIEVAVLIDSSESIGPRYREEIAQLIHFMSETAAVPDENFSIFSFHGQQPILVCKGNCRGAHAADLIPAASSEGLTPLYDSLLFTTDSLSQTRDPYTRRVLILFSDGDDTISKNSAGDAMEALMANDIQVYSVVVTRSPSQGSAFLRDLAAATGGRNFQLTDGADNIANAVLADVHASYQITYKLPYLSAGFHTIRILPTHDLNLHFRCRRGYYYPASSR